MTRGGKHLQKMRIRTNDEKMNSRIMIFPFRFLFVMAFLLTLFFPLETTKAATNLKLYNYATKATTTYTDKQVTVTLNGEKISDDRIPGILVNNIALVSYYDVFKKSDIQAKCIYDKPNQTITISKYGTTIVMKINSLKATVNGKAVTLPVAPVKIKFKNINKTRILVPSRFVSETLGLDYTWYKSSSTVAIEKGSMLLSYNAGDKFDYTGTLGTVRLDGASIGLGNMPSIITNNTAMLRAKRVFADSNIDANYQYNKSTQTVTLSKNGNKLVMTIGSSIAYLNSKPIMLDTPPLIVTNYEVGTSYVMVPGSFTASCLGYDYTWNKSTKTSMITTRSDKDYAQENDPPSNNEDIELGSSSVEYDTGTILHQIEVDDSTLSMGTHITSLNKDDSVNDNLGSIFGVMFDSATTHQNAETFAVYASQPFGKVTSNKSDQTITVQAYGLDNTNKSYQLNDSKFINNVQSTFDEVTSSTMLDFNLSLNNYSYDLSLSADSMILYVTVYSNALTSITIGTNSSGDYIALTGLHSLHATVTEQDSFLSIEFPFANFSMDDVYKSITGARYITQFYCLDLVDRTQILLNINDGYEVQVTEADNQVLISLLTQDGTQTSGQEQSQPTADDPSQNSSSIIDSSKYEIIIPKPDGVTINYISDEDDYFNHMFYIRLAGNYSSFYSTNDIAWKSSAINYVSVSHSTSQTEIAISTSRLQGYEYVVDDDYIYIHIGEPRSIYKNIVVLDAGHGGGANGAQYFNTKEKDINLQILYEIGNKYFNSDPSTLKVYYTRETDVDMSLSNRAAYAKKMGADLFVSLHMNASTVSSAYGTEVYYSSSNSGILSGMNSADFAKLMVNNLTNALGTNNRGAKAQRYTVVHKNTVPAILIELGFMSNASDFALITDHNFQDKAVRVIYNTLLEVFDAYPTGR